MTDDHPGFSTLELSLPSGLLRDLTDASRRAGSTPQDLAETAIRRYLARSQGANTVYLSAPINALVEGLLVENTTIDQIKEHGDFGLGTFNYLDGEMVILDGEVFQIRSDGKVYAIGDDEKSPFACVTFFTPDTFDDVNEPIDETDFFEFLDRLIPSANMLYAIRIDGIFSHVRTRAVPKSENYKPLVQVAKDQILFDFHDVRGSLAGFYTPRFMESLHAPGYHLHLLTEDRKHGGHLMACALKEARIGIQHIPALEVGLPVTFDYLTADLTRDIGKDLEKAEK